MLVYRSATVLGPRRSKQLEDVETGRESDVMSSRINVMDVISRHRNQTVAMNRINCNVYRRLAKQRHISGICLGQKFTLLVSYIQSIRTNL